MQPENVTNHISIEDALSTTTKLLLGFGFCFQLPVVAFFLAKIGLIDYKDMLGFFRYALVGIFIISALLTPPDPVSQVLMALPLTLLYGVGVIVVYFFSTKNKDELDDLDE
jgi:sec-independent protein translocase protein TatC